MTPLSALLFAASGVGLVLCAVQLWAARRHLKTPAICASGLRPVSVLKPLCGVDDDLAASLERFAELDYPRYEVLLGVRDRGDPAYAIARAQARRFPDRLRVVVQRGEPGLNPKVNQLITLARAARYDLLVVSDSNITVERDYLREIAGWLERPEVGLVTHPVVGVGEERIGSLMDNVHLTSFVAAGMIGAQRVVGKGLVVGKSMALRRRELEAVGGFAAVADVLAEDWVMGRLVTALGKSVVVAQKPVWNVSRRRSVREFVGRYRRWSVMHRQAVGPFVYSAELLLHPLPLALGGFGCSPSRLTLAALATGALCKLGYDMMALRILRGRRPPLLTLIASPLKDLLVVAAWADGLFRREIAWRSNRLRVLQGTRLERPAEAAASTPLDGAAGSAAR
jgi:ceramide glucosyltransferase